MFINGAFVSPDRRSPLARTKRNRRSPTAPSGRRSIASGWSNAVDLTGSEVEALDDRHGHRTGSGQGRPVTIRGAAARILRRPVRGDPHADRAGNRSGTTSAHGSRDPRCPGPTTRAARSSMRNANGSGGATGSASDGPRSFRSPGDYIVRDLAGESIFITRNEQRELHGLLQRLQPPRDRSSWTTSRRPATSARRSSARTTRGRTT